MPELDPGGAAAAGTGLQRLPSAVGGVLVSMSNPYWWIWWATVGSAFMVQYRIGWGTWPLLAAFFAGARGRRPGLVPDGLLPAALGPAAHRRAIL